MPSFIKKIVIITGVIIVSSITMAVAGFGASNASAQVINRNDAINEINNRCSSGQTIAHAGYGSNARINVSNGNVVYDFNVLWKRCNNNYTREYAITGYDGDACPAVGKYHLNNSIETRDCIKYTDRHGEGRSHGVCGSYRCVYPGFNANVRKGGAGGPANDGVIHTQFIASRSVTVPDWWRVGQSSGQADVFVANICGAHYYNSSQWGDTYCIPSYVRVSWSRAFTINGQSYIENGGPRDSSGNPARPNKARAVSGTVNNVEPGHRVFWYHDLRNNGPHRTPGILFNVDKDGFSNGWNANKDPRNTGPPERRVVGEPGQLFVYEYAHFPDNPSRAPSSHTVYDVTQADVGNRLCQRISWSPRSATDSETDYGWGSARWACADVPFNYRLTPSLSGDVNPNNPVEAQQRNLNIVGHIANSGPTKSVRNIAWQITQLIYNPSDGDPPSAGGGSSNSAACDFFTGERGCSVLSSGVDANGIGYPDSRPDSYTATANIGDEPVGTKICFVMSVRPNASNSGDWRHSQLYCRIVSKKPKVQVIGGDLVVGKGTTSNVVTSIVRKDVDGELRSYGSFVEYGVAASGSITGFASGSGYANGERTGQFCSVSYLTITNAGSNRCTDTTPKGVYSYGAALPNVGSRFLDPQNRGNNPSIDLPTTENGIYTGRGTIRISGSDIQAGRYVVINAPTANVIITDPIRYTDATLRSLDDIPQVVIIANNILIEGDVDRVDAWLIANGTSGRIVTCTDVASANELSANRCNTKLTVNGPVAAREMLLYRTHGSGTGAESGEPAEVFNLRPDAYLWATNYISPNGRLQTSTTTELPPRF
jgi:hypothetical protein